MAERILEYARGAAARAAPYARQAGILSLPGIVTGIGVGISPKAMHLLASNKTTFNLFKSLKEWGPAVLGVGLGMIWELLKKRFAQRLTGLEYVDNVVYGVVGGLIGQSVSVLAGMPFAIIVDGKLHVKNIEKPKNSDAYILTIDGTPCVTDAENYVQCPESIEEGAHDVAVLGDKAFYIRQYVEGIRTMGGATAKSLPPETITLKPTESGTVTAR